MSIRSVYYFVWFFLAAVSFVYMTGCLAGKRRSALLIFLLLCAGGNWFYNFYPNVAKYKELNSFGNRVADALIEEGVDCVYHDFGTRPIIASSSKGKITSNLTVTTDSPDQLFRAPTFTVNQNAFKNIDSDRSRIVFAVSEFSTENKVAYLQTGASEEYRQEVSKKLKLESVYECSYMTLYIYSFSDGGIIAGVDY